ncbi:hypothetical protein [Nocardiopsis suaedae]|uniref:Uncharacterized protein n=1 Tax=Nocardiopsis suaedae TaxID=3018444 RepID=A0ABT4TWR2_9ACTN|nr:hypothetical protein [Nocardiopsis suaedae]MDA2808684.1 hypothetical protein [Nocardiopsis suaedae]
MGPQDLVREKISAANAAGDRTSLYAIMAITGTHMRPAFGAFASGPEVDDYSRVIELLWDNAASPQVNTFRELRQAFLSVWPFNDDDPDEGYDDSSPVYHKLMTLDPLHFFTFNALEYGLEDAATVGVLTACDLMTEFGFSAANATDAAGEVQHSGELERMGEHEEERLSAELDALAQGGTDVLAACRRRALGRERRVRSLLVPNWVKANSWDPDYRARAHGLQDTLGNAPER